MPLMDVDSTEQGVEPTSSRRKVGPKVGFRSLDLNDQRPPLGSTLGKRLRVAKRKKADRTTRLGDLDADDDNGHGGGDEEDEESRRETRERTERGWITRKEGQEGRGARLRANALQENMPRDDLLRALHRHASQFYTSASMLYEPVRQSRKTYWGSKKRLYLQESGVAPVEYAKLDRKYRPDTQGDVNEEEPPEEPTIAATTSRVLRTRPGPRTGYREDENEEEVSNESIDEEGKKRRRGPKAGAKYLRKDMFRAFDGSALLALGMLVEEFITKQIEDAGYRHNESQASSSRAAETETASGQMNEGTTVAAADETGSHSEMSEASIDERHETDDDDW